MWIERKIKDELLDLMAQYSVVMISGPRQAGKTSLAKITFPEKPYFTLENPDTRSQIVSDPRSFFNSIPNGAIIDEFQRYPELLSYIQGIVDEKKIKGQFLLTGSNNVLMSSHISQSLAGRVGILKLLPLSFQEITQINTQYTSDDYLLNGFYPAIYADALNPTKAYRNYYETYVERDIRQLIQIKDLFAFQRFIKLSAGRIGQLFNANSLANEVGVSSVTIQSWLSALQTSYLAFLMPPWHSNLNKRVVKTPKLYFYDVGLACYLLGIEKLSHIETHPLRGSLFENMVVVELLKKRFNAGMDNNLYFYRDNHGNEVDVIQESGNNLNIYEIKSAQTFNSQFLKGLEYFKKITKNPIETSSLIFAGEDSFDITGNSILNYKNL